MPRNWRAHQPVTLVLSAVLLAGCSSSGTTTSTPTVAAVSVSPASSSIAPGNTVQLAASPKDGSGSPVGGQTVTWSSANASVASVSTRRAGDRRHPGWASDHHRHGGGCTGIASVTVTPVPVAQVTLAPPSTSIVVGTTVATHVPPRKTPLETPSKGEP